MTVFCPICESSSAESQERLREIARLGLARFLNVARKARMTITPEQQREILQALVTWDGAGSPGEVDWLVHEHVDRAAHYAVLGLNADERLIEAVTTLPPWDANNYGEAWDCAAERRIAAQLKQLSTTEN